MKLIFATVGTIAALLGVATLVMAIVFYIPEASPRAIGISLLYFGIAGACFYAVARLRHSGKSMRR